MYSLEESIGQTIGLAEIIQEFRALKIPAKISDSGLGDCAIGLGEISRVGIFQTYALQVEPFGVSVCG